MRFLLGSLELLKVLVLKTRFLILLLSCRQKQSRISLSDWKGNYRIYYWQNGRATNLADVEEKHTAFGISIDQKVDDYITLSARYGQQIDGQARFDKTLTLAADFGGSYWSRGGDAIGISFGCLTLSDDYKTASNDLVAFNASGNEQIAEIYYRYRINSQIDISPNIQYISQPGGNQDASAMTALGIRAQLNF